MSLRKLCPDILLLEALGKVQKPKVEEMAVTLSPFFHELIPLCARIKSGVETYSTKDVFRAQVWPLVPDKRQRRVRQVEKPKKTGAGEIKGD